MKSANRRRVLVVDDESMVTDWLKMVVEQGAAAPGYEVRAAAVGSRAVEIFQSWRPDVVLIDLVLPDIEPEDLSRPKPLIGGRRTPIRRHEIKRETVEIDA